MADWRFVDDLTALAQLQALLTQTAADAARTAADEAAQRAENLANAEELVQAAARAWSMNLASARFDPLMGLMLADEVLAKDGLARQRREEHEICAAEAADQKERFDRARAEEKIGQTLLRDARRHALRRLEDGRLSEASDRITAAWGRS